MVTLYIYLIHHNMLDLYLQRWQLPKIRSTVVPVMITFMTPTSTKLFHRSKTIFFLSSTLSKVSAQLFAHLTYLYEPEFLELLCYCYLSPPRSLLCIGLFLTPAILLEPHSKRTRYSDWTPTQQETHSIKQDSQNSSVPSHLLGKPFLICDDWWLHITHMPTTENDSFLHIFRPSWASQPG